MCCIRLWWVKYIIKKKRILNIVRMSQSAFVADLLRSHNFRLSLSHLCSHDSRSHIICYFPNIAIHCVQLWSSMIRPLRSIESSDNDWEWVHVHNAMELGRLQLSLHAVPFYARQHWNRCDRRQCNRLYALNRLVPPTSIDLIIRIF